MVAREKRERRKWGADLLVRRRGLVLLTFLGLLVSSSFFKTVKNEYCLR